MCAEAYCAARHGMRQQICRRTRPAPFPPLQGGTKIAGQDWRPLPSPSYTGVAAGLHGECCRERAASAASLQQEIGSLRRQAARRAGVSLQIAVRDQSAGFRHQAIRYDPTRARAAGPFLTSPSLSPATRSCRCMKADKVSPPRCKSSEQLLIVRAEIK